MEIANFFWHGSRLSIYEHSCIASFVHHGFLVRVWGYADMDLPVGVEKCDARLIFPESQINQYTHAGTKGSLVLFSDYFRYKLLSGYGGWWFDSDVLCLRDQGEFALEEGFVFGFEHENFINNAVLKIPNHFAIKLLDRANMIGRERGWCLDWGDVGPKLLTEMAFGEGVMAFARPESKFYPIYYSNALDALDPDKSQEIERKCGESLTYHFWNEILRLRQVPKNLMPPNGSFLHNKFIEYDPSLLDKPCLSHDNFLKIKSTEIYFGE